MQTKNDMTKPEDQKAKRCPICGKPATAEAAPFCSFRCANIDLGRWLGEKYTLPAEEDQEDEVLTPSPQQDSE